LEDRLVFSPCTLSEFENHCPQFKEKGNNKRNDIKRSEYRADKMTRSTNTFGDKAQRERQLNNHLIISDNKEKLVMMAV
jgi:hypothetical protein